jgi:sporulation protein YqfC
MFKNLREYINDTKLVVTIYPDKIDIINYTDINHISKDKVILMANNKIIIIKGENLAVAKLLNDEVLISGNYNDIEFR